MPLRLQSQSACPHDQCPCRKSPRPKLCPPHDLEVPMYTSEKTARMAQARHLQENLVTQLARGREWATPGIETALHRALTGLDSGIEAASPRIQASLRVIADELAGGVDAVVPRVHERITRITPQVITPRPEHAPAGPESGRQSRSPWWIAGIAAAAAFYCVTLWRRRRSVSTPPAATSGPDDQIPGEGSGAPA